MLPKRVVSAAPTTAIVFGFTGYRSAGLKNGQAFTLRLAQPIRIFGIRVIGKPASGDKATQSFASCSELQAFAEQHPSKGHLVRIQRATIGSEALPDVFSFKRQNPAL